MRRKNLGLNTSNKKLFKFDFDHSPRSYSQSNINVISNLKLKKSRPKKVPIK